MTTLTVKTVRAALMPDTCCVRDGVCTIRRGFFYTNGFTAEKYRGRVLAAYPNADILDYGEVWKPFRGGASVAAGSHWFVKFRLKPPEAL